MWLGAGQKRARKDVDVDGCGRGGRVVGRSAAAATCAASVAGAVCLAVVPVAELELELKNVA